MTFRGDGGEATTLAPDNAFAVLGNDTRIQILQTLGEADDPLSFSDLRSAVGLRHGGQFNYHLDKLVGHFVQQTDEGYTLQRAGQRVVEAVLSGSITHDPVMEPTTIDERCPYCDAPTMVAYQQERVEQYCTDCTGHYGLAATTDKSFASVDYGFLGAYPLPPAGLLGRGAADVQQAASTWGSLKYLAVASRVCPSCSAALDESIRVCEAHNPTNGACGLCLNRHAVQITLRCPNCSREFAGAFVLGILANIDMLTFLTTHGINPISPGSQTAYEGVVMDYGEEILSTDPFKARFTFTIDDDTLELTVNDELNVVEISER